MSNRLSWFNKGKSLEYISESLKQATEKIRIATGFFTIKGWNLVRRYTAGKQTYLLVGLDEPGEQRARLALTQEIMRDLRTGLDKDRRKTVRDLINKIQSQQFEVVDARATDHHNKLYICDETVAIQTSSNLTGKGLKDQVEGGNLIDEKNEILALIEEFDGYFLNAIDLTLELLEALLKWLQFATPWDIYLKTMLAFENIQPPRTRYNKKPVSYQVDMIAQTLRQIKDHSGSMIVASTGLGKTVVAVHVALHLREENLIDNVMIIGPKAVESNWKKEMREAGLYCEFFVQKIFDQKSSRRAKRLDDFEEIIEESERQPWLLIIDESHEFRNRYKKDLFNLKINPEERIAFTRIREFVKKGSLKVLLLTGSPYATDINNINSQLYLLPHTAERKSSDYDYFVNTFPEWEEQFIKDPNAWCVQDVNEFIKLQIISQLTTPHVARYYGQKDEQGTYIRFGEEKRYIPHIVLHTIIFPLILEAELTDAITEGYFDTYPENSMYKDNIKTGVKVAWASSPLALQGVLECIIDTPGGKNSYQFEKQYFKFSRKDREAYLKPIITQIKNFSSDNDIKIVALSRIIEKAIKNKQKVIIFSERRATIVYLKENLSSRFPSLKIAHTIEMNEDDNSFNMKDSHEIEKMIAQFSPIANNQANQDSDGYNIFISTDTHGVGVNMQDASIVINYDIAWTPISPVQRAGRILRFWHEPRTVEIYTFVAILTNKSKQSDINDELNKIQKRWKNLMDRHQESKILIELPVLTTEQTQEVNLPGMASQVIMESGEMDINALAELEISPHYQHTAKLQSHRDYAKALSDDLMSCKLYPYKQPLLFLLLFYNKQYSGIFYDPTTQTLTQPDTTTILDRISCDEETPIANINYDEIENLSDVCLRLWCEQNNILPENVERICSLYLKPEHEEDNIKEILPKPN